MNDRDKSKAQLISELRELRIKTAVLESAQYLNRSPDDRRGDEIDCLFKDQIMRTANVIILTLDKDANITLVNDYIEKISGYSRNELIGKNWFKTFIPGEEMKRIMQVFREVWSGTNLNWGNENHIRCKDGSQRLISWQNTRILDNAGKTTSILSIGNDVTERAEVMEEMQSTMERFYSVFDGMSDGVILLNNKIIIQDVNKAMLEITGLKKEYLLGKSAMTLAKKLLTARDLPKTIRNLQTLLKGKPFKNTTMQYKGKVLQASVAVDFNSFGIVAVFRDITDLRIAEQKLKDHSKNLEKIVAERTNELKKQNKALEKSRLKLTGSLQAVQKSEKEQERLNQRLVEVNKELESFSYSVSHDLKAPLRAISGFSKILKEDHIESLDDAGRKYLNLIHANSINMGQLINNLLEFSRMGRADVRLQKIDQNALLDEIITEILSNQTTKKIVVKVDSLPAARADINMLRQVWSNLLSNAVKFTAGVDKPEIVISCEEQKRVVKYNISDNGVGFDMKYAHRLFNVFQRLHTSEEYEGSGIGLALVKRIVGKHNGSVGISSRKGKGTTVHFTLPKP